MATFGDSWRNNLICWFEADWTHDFLGGFYVWGCIDNFADILPLDQVTRISQILQVSIFIRSCRPHHKFECCLHVLLLNKHGCGVFASGFSLLGVVIILHELLSIVLVLEAKLGG